MLWTEPSQMSHLRTPKSRKRTSRSRPASANWAYAAFKSLTLRDRTMRTLTSFALAATLLLSVGCLPQEASPPREAYAAVDLDVHQTPAPTAAVVARLIRGTSVHVGGCADGWCGIASGEITGYAIEAYLSDSLPPDLAQGSQIIEQGRGYTNAYGEWVPSPAWTADNQPPEGASAQCRDGSYSFSRTRRGTCSWHGGVARWLPRADSIRR